MKTAIVFGATSGIGKEISELLLKDGYKVAITGRRLKKLEALKKQYSNQVYVAQNDIQKVDEVEIKERKRPKYTPLSKRQDRPDAILWLCKNASELTDGQISKLVGSTKGTVSLIRKRSYWNFSNLKPRDPVILALCTQEIFQKSLEKAKRRVEREKKAKIREEKKSQAASV